MRKPNLEIEKVRTIKSLRKTGHSIHEIARIVRCSKSSVQRYVAGVSVEKRYTAVLLQKQRVSTHRSVQMWEEEIGVARRIIEPMSSRDAIILMIGLYWGEGTKRELNLINGDPALVRQYLQGLYALGVSKQHVRINIRVYGEANKEKCRKFWLNYLQLSNEHLVGYEVLSSSGETRLQYGMCRVRIAKPQRFFKRIMSVIHLLGRS